MPTRTDPSADGELSEAKTQCLEENVNPIAIGFEAFAAKDFGRPEQDFVGFLSKKRTKTNSG